MRFETRGIEFRGGSHEALIASKSAFIEHLKTHQLLDAVEINEFLDAEGACVAFTLKEACKNVWAPDWDTTLLNERLGIDSRRDEASLDREILIAMLLATIPFVFPTYKDLAAAIRIRHHIVRAGYLAELNFDTDATERPLDCWHYDEDAGFLLNQDVSIIHALTKATQPDGTHPAYSFSCYRATEYVILLGIAQELQHSNPDLLKRLEKRSEKRAIRSGEFHEVFLREYGSIEHPFPMKYYVPGDRVWFRNPDDRSSDISGYEGSWVIYLGHNLFTNFWKRNSPFTLQTKCVEVFHWKDGAYLGEDGELHMDESIVELEVAKSLADPGRYAQILERMMRYRDPKGVYDQGGCIDTSRESPRWVCPLTGDLVIPD